MNHNLNRNKIHALATIDELNASGDREIKLIDGVLIKINSQRYGVFKKSLECCECGLKATHFASEKDDLMNTQHYHLNLYGIKDGEEVLFTKDHINPKSLGGGNVLSNYQTMCYTCNYEKQNIFNDKDKLIAGLMQQTFHHSDETAKPIVDDYVKEFPQILDYFKLQFLYKV